MKKQTSIVAVLLTLVLFATSCTQSKGSQAKELKVLVWNIWHAGGVEIDMDGTPVRLFDTWLHYLPDMRLAPTVQSEAEILAWDNEETRDEEVRKILSVLQPILSQADSIPVIMGGDFNTHSHLDWTEATQNKYNHGGAVVRWTVSEEMQKANFKDSFREMNPDPAKNIGTT